VAGVSAATLDIALYAEGVPSFTPVVRSYQRPYPA